MKLRGKTQRNVRNAVDFNSEGSARDPKRFGPETAVTGAVLRDSLSGFSGVHLVILTSRR